MSMTSSPAVEAKFYVRSLFIRKVLPIFLFMGFALLTYYVIPAECPESGKRTAVIFVLAAFFWAFEVMPHYATSLMVIIMLIFGLTGPEQILNSPDISYKIFLTPFASPIIILFLSGFIFAKALNKYQVDCYIAEKVLFRFGSHPYAIMGGLIIATASLSMWMSNIATTAIMLGIITPMLKQLKEGETFTKGLILAIPFSANIGGIATPVGCTPNIVALGNLSDQGTHLPFLNWMVMGVPLTALFMILVFFMLIKVFPLKDKTMRFVAKSNVSLNQNGLIVLCIFGLIITLWLTSHLHGIPEPAIALFGAALLVICCFINKHDLNSLDWDILILMWGGLALGKGMQVSGLITWMTSLSLFQHPDLVLFLFCGLGFLFSNFMSHTAAATLLIPAAISIPGSNPIFNAITVSLVCSFAMAFPVSTPPNAMAYALGKFSTKDMFKTGAPISIITTLVMLVTYKFLIGIAFKI
jgi:solute carrier family 13 (sodium-dependent dicarboxylate transporter), member 2/3/5